MASHVEAHHLVEKVLAGEQVFLSLAGDPATRFEITRIERSPCTMACPAGVNVKGYIGLISAGRFREALELIKRDNPLPGICGRVCHHPCEKVCKRSEIDEPVAICWLKRFVADYELEQPKKKTEPLPRTRKEKVAIVGSGPAGLTAANDLVRMGYGVTIFEALPVPGGMLTVGIPSFRLPRNIIETEIQAIVDLGVEIKTNTKIGRDVGLEELFKQGYNAAFLAVGAHVGRRLGIPGEEGDEGYVDCVEFMRRINFGDHSLPGRHVVVIGGGHSAMDCARTALRLGAEEVQIVYRRSRKEMPADILDVNETESEGVKLTLLVSPSKILRQNGKVVGIELIRNRLGEPDASGRRRPVPIEGSEFVINADLVISAISEEPDLSVTAGDFDFNISRWNTFVVDDNTLATNVPGVFAGGDAVTGPKTVIEAIAHGHKAARAIHRYLCGKESISPSNGQARSLSRAEAEIKFPEVEKRIRHPMPRLLLEDRRHNFNEVELGFTEEMAVEEAKRCLKCGPCGECLLCVPTCDKRQTILSMPEVDLDLLVRVPRDSERFPVAGEAAPAFLRPPRARRKEVPVQVEPVTCYVLENFCRGCGTCVEVCEYDAAALEDRGNGVFIARIDESLCRGCGVCASRCPSSAIVPRHFTDEWIDGLLNRHDLQSKVVVFSCNWNAAITDELLRDVAQQNSAGIETVRVMCAGRIPPAFVLKAFERGAAGVVMLRCPADECHYGFGSRVAEENFAIARKTAHLLGIAPQRIQQRCVGAAENSKFVGDFEALIHQMQGVNTNLAES
jgi:NADPH-dependent glutamate synthase beta subunit-like oxidoreductase/coenzyme F420-reducing hydrogenase delta subunit/NAD-dependent dihydropyrimidine dehydrogenase PreA subunit